VKVPTSAALRRFGTSIAHRHTDRRKIGEETVDSHCQITLDFRLEIATGRRPIAHSEVFGKKFVLRAERPHMNAEIERMRRSDARGRCQRLGNSDRIGILRNGPHVAELGLEKLHERQMGQVAEFPQMRGSKDWMKTGEPSRP